VEAVVPVWAWGTLALVVLIAVIAYLLWRRKRGQQSALPAPVVIVDWLAEVRKLLASELIPKSEFNAYYTQLSEALRRFVEQKTGADVMERTTFEVRSDLNAVGMAESRILEIEGFLNEADLVKFAKFEPDAGRAVTDGKRVLALMETIDREYAVAIESEEVVPS